jgi:hypothetical protein
MMTRGLQLSCGGPKCLSALSGISWRCWRGTLKRVLAFKKAKTLNQIKFRKPMPGRLRKISIPTRIQGVIIQEGEWPDTITVYGLYI